MKLPKQQKLYIRSMGKALRVTAICTSVSDANLYMERNTSDAVVAEIGPFIIMADKYDRGTVIGADDVEDSLARRT